MVKVFCVDGVVVEIDGDEAAKRLPFDIMTLDEQPTMVKVLKAQGKLTDYLSPMPSSYLLSQIPGAVLENINKKTVNMVAEEFGGDEVYGEDESGILD